MTNKQRRFCEEYLIDLCATQAAIRAGYSPHTAASIGEQNLRKLEIEKAVSKAMAERSRRTGVNADRVIAELAKIAFTGIADEEIKACDKIKALEQLGRHLGLFNDRLRIDGGMSVVIHDDLAE